MLVKVIAIFVRKRLLSMQPDIYPLEHGTNQEQYGIKNGRVNPTLVTVLPSGIGVYKSPFADIWGSRYKFAGPLAVFSRGG